MRHINFLRTAFAAVIVVAFGLVPSSQVWAHGGGGATTSDTCRVEVGGHWVHFTTYLPMLTGTAEYCQSIPNPGLVNLVFDYEGRALRNMSVEFEVTKEPEGTRMTYKEPHTYPNGTVNQQVNLEPGKYLAHVTLINEGNRVDAHLPFTVLTGNEQAQNQMMFIILLVGGAGLYIFYLSNPKFQALVDGLFEKAKNV